MNETIYRTRRERLLAQMEEGAAIVASAPQRTRSHDTEHPYRQSSDFYYLTGFDEDNAVLLLLKRGNETQSVLFVQPKDETMELWTGKRLGVEAAKARFDVDEVYGVDSYETKLPELMLNLPALYLDPFDPLPAYETARLCADRLRHRRDTKRPVTRIIDVSHLVRTMRLIKDDEEIALIRKGLAITADAHHHAMQICRNGMMEYELQVAYEYVFKMGGADSGAYLTIVAGGDNANTLHYVKNDIALHSGELVLVDAGCEYGLYATDITRTFPVGGRFSPAQKEVYEMVLDVQLQVIDAIRPGGTKQTLQELSERLLCEGMVRLGILEGEVDALLESKAHKRYFPHGIGHWMGLDVHDPCPYYDDGGEPIPFAPGMVMTIEPGIYLRADDEKVPERFRGIGIRIEDNVLVTETGCENLSSAIAKTVEEIEQRCSAPA